MSIYIKHAVYNLIIEINKVKSKYGFDKVRIKLVKVRHKTYILLN